MKKDRLGGILKLAAKLSAFAVAAVLFPMLAMVVLASGKDIVSANDVLELPGGPVDAVIVPGARVLSNGAPSGTLLDRILLAQAIVVSGQSELVFASGAANEPRVIANNLAGREVIEDPEGFATSNTCQNAADAGFERVAITTQPRHRNRTAVLCEAYGLDVVVVTTPPARELLSRRPRRFLRERAAEAWAILLVIGQQF